jgi:hypothetical protein
MLNPFQEDNADYHEDIKDTDKFLNTHSTSKLNSKLSLYNYIIIGCIYILEMFTATFAKLNDDNNTGLFHSEFDLHYWLLVSSIYSICGLIAIYQFNQKKYKNKLYFIIYDFIKLCWIFIGCIILFGFNHIIGCNLIIGYSLFYISYNIIYLFFSFVKTIKLNQYDNY